MAEVPITHWGASSQLLERASSFGMGWKEEGDQSYLQWETEMTFSYLRELNPDNPKIKQLINYGQEIEGKFDLLRKRTGLPRGVAELYLGRIPKEDLKPEFEGMILRLGEETGYLDELKDIGISADCLSNLENGRYGAWVSFLAPDSLLRKLVLREGVTGEYLPVFDVAIIGNKPPELKNMWLDLVDQGFLSDVISTLDHELTHDRQFTRAQRTMILAPEIVRIVGYPVIRANLGMWSALGYSTAITLLEGRFLKELGLGNDTILSEVHAYEAAASNPASVSEKLDNRHGIVEFISRNYVKDCSRAQFLIVHKAFGLVRTLRLLGLDDSEIGRLVSCAKYDEGSNTYPKLEKKLKSELAGWGVESEYEQSILVNALLSRQELELRVQRYYAQRIATEELKRASGKKFG